MRVSAKLLPLGGKYYGTKIKLLVDGHEDLIEIWVMGDYKPSERELADGVSEDDLCDTHYESELGYKLAKLLVSAVDGKDL